MKRKRKKSLKVKLKELERKYANHKYLANILARAENDPKYREIRIRYQNQIVCFYCGRPATGVDHQPPLSRIEEYTKLCQSKNKPVHLLKVSCCAECNRLLGNSVFSSFKAKLDNLRVRLSKKHGDIQPENKLEYGRLKRRLSFERGLNRVTGKYE